MKLVYIQEVVQHALTETAGEMATVSYIYHISGLQQMHDSARDGIKSKAEIFKNHIDTIINTYKHFADLPEDTGKMINQGINAVNGGDLGEILENIERAGTLAKNLENDAGNVTDIVKSISGDPMNELKYILCYISSGTFENLKTQVCLPLVKFYFKKYLEPFQIKDPEKRLKGMNIEDGFKGMDFSRSSFFEDMDDDIDIIVRYKVGLPVPFKIFGSFSMVQRASVKAWTGGDTGNMTGGSLKGEDVWSLDNFRRGRKLRAVFGGNLPDSFPVISKFEGGIAISIKSIDLTTQYYQDSKYVIEKINGYINELAGYRGQEEAWGEDGIIIKSSEIRARLLILVIPGNPVKPEISAVLEECSAVAAVKGIALKVEKYGFKKIP